MAKAHEIERAFSADEVESRLDLLLSYVTLDETINNSTRWLQRVKEHSQSEHAAEFSPDDAEFLSRFEYTRVCGAEVETWTEWIEPITITARHPFGFGKCRNTGKHFTRGKPRAGRSDVDYVLLQSGAALYNQTHTPSGRRILGSSGAVGRHRASGGGGNKHYLLDAGTSTFDSSLFWFTCGYSQVLCAAQCPPVRLS